ncbi:MAG: hypothetical protein L0Z48_11490 [candidate division Zixibacteria bacterium]|nr:hypothetical protein [candidate division Zixibacteria bacterium]
MLKRLIQLFTRQNNGKKYPLREASLKMERPKKIYPNRPQAISEPNSDVFRFQTWDRPTRLEFYRFIRDNVPLLNSVIWTWSRLCAAPNRLEIIGEGTAAQKMKAEQTLRTLDERLYQFPFARFGGTDAVLAQFFNSLFTLGAVAGEIVLNPTRTQIEKFFFLDPATLGFVWDKSGNCQIFQQTENGEKLLNPHSVYYAGLDAEMSNPYGRSILGSIPFVAKVEQSLVADMQKTMRNAGYNRIHIKIKPPEKRELETDETYLERANKYFDDTVKAVKELAPEDNPVTWNDVEIEYLGPKGPLSSSESWYITHKAVIEDICAGTHLDPFLLGYSYGTTQTWARFKYELVLRQVVSVQRIAKRFMEWVYNLELALNGIENAKAEFHFDNRKSFDILENAKAEQMKLDNLIKKQTAGYITFDEAKSQAQGS